MESLGEAAGQNAGNGEGEAKRKEPWLPIDPTNKIKVNWDLFVFVTITVAAFEIPYSLVIGWENQNVRVSFDLAFYTIFWLDIVLNFLTVRERSYSGLLDWRDFFAFRWELSPEFTRLQRAKELADSGQPMEPPTVKKLRGAKGEPTIWKQYLCSKWFWIDLVSAFPFELLSEALGYTVMARTLRLARLPRMVRIARTARMFRITRTLKAAGMANRYRTLATDHPAMIRFYALLVIVPWFIHVCACLLCFFEAEVPDSSLYLSMLHDVFFAMKSGDMPSSTSDFGALVGVFVMFVGLIFFGSFIGNFSSLFNNIDDKAAMISAERKKWTTLFKKYPSVFDQNDGALKKVILEEVRHHALKDHGLDDDVNLICSLEDSLEHRVVEAVNAASDGDAPNGFKDSTDTSAVLRHSRMLQELSRSLQIKRVSSGEEA